MGDGIASSSKLVKEAAGGNSAGSNLMGDSNATSSRLNLGSPIMRPSTNNGGGSTVSTPMSYSKALTKSLLLAQQTHNNAAGGGDSCRKLFASATADETANHSTSTTQPLSSVAAPKSTTTTSASYASIFEGYTNPNISNNVTTSLSNELFGISSGIDTKYIQHLLTKSRDSGANNNNNQQWDLRKRLDTKENALCTLRTLITDLLSGKDEFVNGAMHVEKELRHKLLECKCIFDTLSQSKLMLEADLKSGKEEKGALQQQMEHVTKERDKSMTKYDLQSMELQSTKDEVGRLQQSITNHAVELVLLQRKLDEANATKEETLSKLAAMESSNVETVNNATTTIRNEMNAKLSHVQSENDILKKELLIKATETKDICTLMNMNVSAVDFTNVTASNSFVNMIKDRVDELEMVAMDKEGVEEELSSCMAELEKVTSDYQVRGGGELESLLYACYHDLRSVHVCHPHHLTYTSRTSSGIIRPQWRQ